MDKLSALIESYLKDRELVWSKSTLHTAAPKIRNNFNMNPRVAYDTMKTEGYAPYTIKNYFILFAGVEEWMIEQQITSLPNKYKRFMERHSNLFRNAYQDKYTELCWEEFEDELRKATVDSGFRTALALLGYAGCRLSELHTFDGRTVMGKGAKRRIVHVPDEFKSGRVSLSTHQIRRKLRNNPHEYRKLAADTWLRGGIDLKTVQNLLGHNSITSTQRYLRPLESDVANEKLNNIWGTN